MLKQLKSAGRKLLGKGFSPGSLLYKLYHKSRGVTAAMIWGFPSSKMVIIGVTGTNGKTTTANLLAYILETAGKKTGLATTVNFWDGKRKLINETKMTTLSPFALQKLLRQMVANKCEYAVIETSSHALAQHRTWGIFYDVAIFTNLTQDHFDYHNTFEEYREAKAKLFRELATSQPTGNVPKIAVLNVDDPSWKYFDQYPANKKVYFTLSPADELVDKKNVVAANNIDISPTGNRFTLDTPIGEIAINSKLVGAFNIQNSLAAAGAALALGTPLETIKRGLESINTIPGRMEKIEAGQQFDVITDYAHTPDSFQQVFSTVEKFTEGKIIAVFGAAGDRDKSKRPILGKIAGEYADILILTEEDPGSEDPAKIIDEVKTGIPENFKEGENMFTILDRKGAVRRALELAQPDDTVLLLALGAQTVMATREGTIPYDEREFAKSVLQLAVGKTNSHPGLDPGPRKEK